MGVFAGLKSQTVLPIGLSGLTTENYVFSRTYLDSTTTSNTSTKQIQSVAYFDGLGRAKQTVAIKSSQSGEDLVTAIPYDNFGRQVDSWLPTPMSSLSGGIQPGVEASATTFYVDTNPFSHKTLENSPLDRVNSLTQVGGAWQSNPVVFGYETNIAQEVFKYFTTTTWPDNATLSDLKLAQATDLSSFNYCYKANQLYKNTVTDEDGNVSIEFKNGEGQTILVRKILSPTENIDTYYVYNEFNQLAFVIPPKAVSLLFPVPANSADGTVLSDLCYQYRYDGRGRLVEKKLPGKGWEYMVYDNQDRLVMTQDANMGTTDKKWLFTKYDKFGRVAYTGIYTSTQSYDSTGRDAEQTILNGKGSNNVERTNSGSAYGSGVTLFYDNLSTNNYPNSITELLSINYYDTYPTITPVLTIPPAILGQNVLKQPSSTSITSTKSLPTATFVKNIGNSSWTKTFIWYDTKGRSVGSNSINYKGGFTKTETELNFGGIPQRTNTYHSRLSSINPVVTIRERFVYNPYSHALEKHYHNVNNQAEDELLAENTYNEVGQLISKKVGGTAVPLTGVPSSAPIESINYQYNIRGWLTGINLNAAGDMLSGKLFNYKVNYNETLTSFITKPYTADQTLEVKAKFNGNISAVTWKSSIDPTVVEKKYGYVYDKLNRLSAGFYYEKSGTSFLFTEEYNELLKYDFNGNIDKLKRFSFKQGTAANMIDDLHYYYTGNKLDHILDNPSGTSNPAGYEGGGVPNAYDSNGNMTTMPDKSITQPIVYNYLNLPSTITQWNNTTTNFLYRADGTKLKKTLTVVNKMGTSILNTEYLDGFQYSTPNTDPLRMALEEQDDATVSMATATNEETFSPLEDRAIIAIPENPADPPLILSFFPTAEGFYDYENMRYIYQYKDHLGNVRVSYVKDRGSVKVMDTNDYYPFGLSFLKPSTIAVYDPLSIPYNYKYNGKELQETGMYDYGARMYMPDIGRWGVIDEFAESSRRTSPYHYAHNNPLRFIDPDGRISINTIQDMFTNSKNGMITTYTNDGNGGFQKTDERSPVLNVTRTTLENGKLIPTQYGFTPSAAHLLSLVSGVNYDDVYGTSIVFKNYGNGALTTGNSASDGTITNFNINANNIISFLELMSHEIGHLPQLDEAGGNTNHLAKSGWGYVKAAIKNGSTKYEDYHDKAPLEIAAERGTFNFRDFNNFVNKNYGANKLKNLFENNNNSEKDRVQRINQWFKAYENEIYQKNNYKK